MEYQKIINLLEDTSNEPSKFRTKKWVEINGDLRGRYSADIQVKFNTSMLKSCLCNFIDAYIYGKGNKRLQVIQDRQQEELTHN